MFDSYQRWYKSHPTSNNFQRTTRTTNTAHILTGAHRRWSVAKASAPLLHYLATVEVRQAGFGMSLQSAIPAPVLGVCVSICSANSDGECQ